MKTFQVLILSIIMIFSFACDNASPGSEEGTQFEGPVVDLTLAKQMYDFHEKVRNPVIKNRRFKHKDIASIVQGLDPAIFEVKKAGESIEGRDIYLIKAGQGETSVLLWSQMHGNEPTATMALMDLFNFFEQKDELQELKATLLNELSIYFIPMLNPDGAERFERRNTLGVDLNRDALRLQSPEARLLKAVRDSLNAEWGFNLHDQNRYYATGQNPNTASVSFLAPAYNFEKEVNEPRGEAMQVIVAMNEVLQQHIPKMVGRYSDAFEPRAFGDNIQKWGTRTILIESGSIKGDREKQELRRLNFTILLTAFNEIASGTHKRIPLALYDEIPFNNSNSFQDLILRKATVEINGKPYVIDLAFRHSEVDNEESTDFHFRSFIADLGDLSTQYGYDELDAEGLTLKLGKSYPSRVRSEKRLSRLDPVDLLKNGFTHVYMKDPPEAKLTDQSPLVINNKVVLDGEIRVGQNPPMILQQQDGKVRYAIINGFLWDLDDEEKIREAWKGF